jgi:hypothetical protein
MRVLRGMQRRENECKQVRESKIGLEKDEHIRPVGWTSAGLESCLTI